MDETTVSLIRFLFFAGTIFLIIKSIAPNRGLKNKQLYYEFCQIRRDLMSLILENKIDAKSLSSSFCMRFVSDVVHYSDDYDIGTGEFFKSIQADSKDLAEQKFIDKLFADVKKQDKEFQNLFKRIMGASIRLFESNSIVMIFVSVTILREILSKKRPHSRYTYAARAAKTVKSTYACAT